MELWEEWMGLVLAFWGWEKSSKCQMPRPTEDSHTHTATCVPAFGTESTMRLIISRLSGLSGACRDGTYRITRLGFIPCCTR